jgi:23S rRNA (guanine2445-N2)-methyltransferase / 23S rRNA (guanine2069-N7)-methyltransferase
MKAGVRFSGDLETAYRVCLWSRLANRVLLKLGEYPAESDQQLYDVCRELDWSKHLSLESTFRVSASVSRSNITHSQYAGLKIKDAIVDQFREQHGSRPNVSKEQPDVQINAFIDRNQVELAIDLSGESLHQRGYRTLGGVATLKENLAAALLYRAGWPELMKQDRAFVDFMCGSGTLPIEAAMMACDIAPGLSRDYFGLLGWNGHNAAVWQRIVAEAEFRRDQGLRRAPVIQGFDNHRPTLDKAIQHAENAGLGGIVQFAFQDVFDFKLDFPKQGLVVVNPPYGNRVGDKEALPELYGAIGDVLKNHFMGWQASVFTDELDNGKALKLRAKKIHSFFNGNIECKLLSIDVTEDTVIKPYRLPRLMPLEELSDAALGLRNRLKKNGRKLNAWRKQNDISCFRLYDADLPDYSAAIDVYESDGIQLHVQEYEAPKTIDERDAKRRLSELLSVVKIEFQVPSEQIYLKQNRRQKSQPQYEKDADPNTFHVVREGPCEFYVNFEDYLDTGLFLDHRPLRELIREQSKGKTLLNLFAYTGAISVHAAMGGAMTTTLDMSNTYLDWAKRNFSLNKIDLSNHLFLRADCVAWLQQPATDQYDIVVLDPPSFSKSKKMEGLLDIQKDYAELIKQSMTRLAAGGSLYFTANLRGFKLDEDALADFDVVELTQQTVPPDFQQRKHVHRCWQIRAIS